MAFSDFDTALREYLSALEQAGKDATHDYRRSVFIEFLGDGFNISARDIPLEEHIKVAEVRGFIDALYRQVIFEFKRDLEREREDGKAELRRYFRAKPQAAFALLTDGFCFEVYVPDGDDIRKVQDVDLRRLDTRDAHLFFDSFLFADKLVAPNSQDVVARFGSSSGTYLAVFPILRDLWERTKDDASAQTKFNEWNRLLAKVYGSEIGNDDLFLRHTYLSLLAKTFAYLALFPEEKHPRAEWGGIVTGDLFARQGYDNLAEEDFFAWVLHPSIRSDALDLLQTLSGRLAVYDLAQVNEDLLKELYQNLVDPATRHDLGEFYTPDWLAELTLREAGYEGKGRLLDPACGSGTFLFTAIRLARAAGVTGASLVDYAVNNISGMDVHPLAVTIAKVNYVLALMDEMRGKGAGVRVPVYVADTIQRVRGTLNGAQVVMTVTNGEPAPPNRRPSDEFLISSRLASNRPLLEIIVDKMRDAAQQDGDPHQIADTFWDSIARHGVDPVWKPDWIRNCKLLIRLIREGRDTIWAFILKNCFEPAYLREHKVNFVVGNPPWLAYNFIKHEDYQEQVRHWTFQYGLLDKDEIKLFTQMDLSTLFFVHCLEQFLKPDGTIAFVMPRSVITGAKQHEKFRGIGFDKILDCREVSNRTAEGMRSLFNVPSCVLIARNTANRSTANVPRTHVAGNLPARNLTWDKAQPHLTLTQDTYTPPAMLGEPSPYYEDIRNGATIFPRCFWFVESAVRTKRGIVRRDSPYLETARAIDRDAKEPWKGKRVSGFVESEFLYATLLGDGLIPFGVRALSLIVLPIIVERKGIEVIDSATARTKGFPRLADWLSKVENLWNAHKKETTEQSVYEWLDYQHKLSRQHPKGVYRVLYNKSGTNLASCVLDTTGRRKLQAGIFTVQGFIAENVTFYYETKDRDEAHYLCAVLNSPFVNDAIKEYQTQGLWGPRDIQRRPFEVLPIPKYDAANLIHQQLARLSKACHAKVAKQSAQLEGNTGKVRGFVRSNVVADELTQIDALTRRLFGASAAPQSKAQGNTLF